MGVKRYDIDSALNCPDYMAVTVDQLDDNSQGFPDRCVALTDSIGRQADYPFCQRAAGTLKACAYLNLQRRDGGV